MTGYFDGADAHTFDLIPAGEYLAEIEDCASGESSNGNPQIRVQFRILTETPGATNRVISDWLIFTDKSKGLILGKTTAIGVDIPGGWSPDHAGLYRLSGKLMHKRTKIVVRHDTYNGETREKIKAWKSTGTPSTRGDDPLADALIAKTGATRLSANDAPLDDDDIPFHHADAFNLDTI